MEEQNISKVRHHKHSDLHIFKRESGIWFAGFHRKGRYFRKSTGTNNLPVALEWAENWYLDCLAAIRIGQFQLRIGHTVREVAKLALHRFEEKVKAGQKSKSYFDGIALLLKSDILPFFGNVQVHKLGPAKWAEYLAHLSANKPKLTRETLHQHRNALRLCLNEAVQHEWLQTLPSLKIDVRGKKDTLPRSWFEPQEHRLLLKTALRHMKSAKQTRHYDTHAECYDLIVWLSSTGMRVGEAYNVRFCDVEVRTENCADGNSRRYCLIKNIRGKRGTGECRSWYGACTAFERIVKRRNICNPKTSEENLFIHSHTGLLNKLLEETGLKFTKTTPPRRRDFVSFRHTYIAHRLINGVKVYDIATNCRTSVAMIENHYARFLSPRYLTDLNRTSNRRHNPPSQPESRNELSEAA